jgi:hypothetical protein
MSRIVAEDEDGAVEPRLADEQMDMLQIQDRRHRRFENAALAVVLEVASVRRDLQENVIKARFLVAQFEEHVGVVDLHILELDPVRPKKRPPRDRRRPLRLARDGVCLLQPDRARLEVEIVHLPPAPADPERIEPAGDPVGIHRNDRLAAILAVKRIGLEAEQPDPMQRSIMSLEFHPLGSFLIEQPAKAAALNGPGRLFIDEGENRSGDQKPGAETNPKNQSARRRTHV